MRGLTLLEMVIAVAIMAILFSALLPHFTTIDRSWDSRCASAQTVQSGRVLLDFLNRNLVKANRIIAVSDPTETNGYIEFEDNSGTIFRCDINDEGNIQYGPVGNLSDLAGPASRLQFLCFSAYDLETRITNGRQIRFVKVLMTLLDSVEGNKEKTFVTQAYLRSGVPTEFAHWKLDEDKGMIAEDSAGDFDGLLRQGPKWQSKGGIVGGCLKFDGKNDYVEGPPLNIVTNEFTICAWIKRDKDQDYYAGIVFCRDSTSTTCAGIDLAASPELRYHWNDDPATWCWHSTMVLPGNQWAFVALVVEPDKAVIYEGIKSTGLDWATNYVNHEIEEFDNVLVIGCDPQGGRYFKGMMDDVRIYDYALSAEEIANIFTGKQTLFP